MVKWDGMGKERQRWMSLLKVAYYDKPPTHNWIYLSPRPPTYSTEIPTICLLQGSDNSSNCHSYLYVRSALSNLVLFPLPATKNTNTTQHSTEEEAPLDPFFGGPAQHCFCFALPVLPPIFPFFFLTCPRRALNPFPEPRMQPLSCRFHWVHLWNRLLQPSPNDQGDFWA